jgi:2-iminobutanoate/2-iminopropanoate deaminase
MARTAIHTEHAPAAIGPYSQAIRAGQLIFASGQIALDPRTGEMAQGGVEAQTRQVLANLAAVLEAGGATLADVVKTTIYLVDLEDFQKVNAIYAEHFPGIAPARATVQVSRLPRNALVEIDAIATPTT